MMSLPLPKFNHFNFFVVRLTFQDNIALWHEKMLPKLCMYVEN